MHNAAAASLHPGTAAILQLVGLTRLMDRTAGDARVVVGLIVDQVYSFDRDALIKAMPKPAKSPPKFAASAGELFDRMMQMADNAGSADEHRALNYLAVRYPRVYARAAEAAALNASLSGIETRVSRLSTTRRILDVIVSFTDRTTAVVDKVFARVDVTEEFPFLVTKLSPYHDR